MLESMIGIAENPPPSPENQLIFLGRYRLTSAAPSGFPSTCPKRETPTSPLCRFEVIVQDNDESLSPSPADSFSIKLSTATCTDPMGVGCWQLPPTPCSSLGKAYQRVETSPSNDVANVQRTRGRTVAMKLAERLRLGASVRCSNQ
jgi:hypothetical protein